MMFCPYCGKEIDTTDSRYCRFCGRSMEAETQSTVSEQGIECPWENMARIGFVRAFIDTLALVLLHPVQFFKHLAPRENVKASVFYAILTGSFGYIMGAVWKMLWKGSMMSRALSGIGVADDSFLAVSIFFAPLIMALSLFIQIIFTHLFLMIVGGNKKGISATARVACYAMSAQVFHAVPVLGGIISSVWATVTIIIGLREIHGISTMRAAMALLLPFIVLFILVILAVIAIVLLLPNLFQEIGREFLPLSVILKLCELLFIL